MAKYIMEPFKIKMVEPVKTTTREERAEKIKSVHYNLFGLRSEDILVDLQTDSGTGAMSHYQWAGLITGDEAYSGSRGYFQLVDAVKDLFGYMFAQPVHQGRAAEKVLLPFFLKQGKVSISNMHFDTTKAHVEIAGARALDCVCADALNMNEYKPFKGNMDVERLESMIKEHTPEKVGVIIMTITNNSAGGQPVSMKNISETAAVAKKYGVPFIIDAARFAENAFFIKEREEGYKDKSIAEIVRQMFSYAEAFTMSAKKDAIVNMGGIIGIKDNEKLYEAVKVRTIPNEGFISYGGLAGRDLSGLAIGLYEGTDYHFLKYRIGQAQYLGDKLKELGVSAFQYPTGGHGVFLDAKQILPHIPYYEFPGQSLSVALYIEGGIRAGDIGSLMMGNDPDTGKQIESQFEFCRMAIPRRVYTQAHFDHIAETVAMIVKDAKKYKGYKITWEPEILRHFTCKMEPLT